MQRSPVRGLHTSDKTTTQIHRCILVLLYLERQAMISEQAYVLGHFSRVCGGSMLSQSMSKSLSGIVVYNEQVGVICLPHASCFSFQRELALAPCKHNSGRGCNAGFVVTLFEVIWKDLA